MKAKLLGLLAFVSVLGLSPANASTYNVNFNIGAGNSVTGTMVTDCDTCVLNPINFISWSFMLNGGLGISSSAVGASIVLSGISPLSATSGVIVDAPIPGMDYIQFFNPGINYLNFYAALTNGNYITYNISGPSPIIWIANGQTLELATIVTPLPAALPLFATGLGVMAYLAKRRKRKSAVAIAAA